jgi:hypothetical protein
MTPILAAPDPTVFAADVLAFAAERGVTDYLAPLYDLARQCFPSGDVQVTHEFDYEIPGLSWIAYQVDTAGLAGEQIFAADLRWTEGVVQMCPPAVSECFTLGMR